MESLELNPNFWRGRRVFLSGHTGFKGGWLLVLLRELGAEVYGFAIEPPTSPSLFGLLALENFCTHRLGDIRDLAAVDAAMQEARPEVVIHMAAQSLVRHSYTNPVETYAVNLMGTVNVLDACRRADRLRSAVMVTTDKCYENVNWVWGYRENDRLGGADPYSNSKATCELAVESYRHSFFNPDRHGDHGVGLASARAGNVIGGGDFAFDRLIPDAVRAFMADKPLAIRNPLAIRPWQHVLEPLTGYLRLAERLFDDPSSAQGWNFGPPTEDNASVELVADRFAACWGAGAAWEQDSSEQPHEAFTLKLDSTKARVTLGWKPRLALDDALRLTADWYRRVLRENADPLALTEEQVRAYRALASEAQGAPGSA